jgi:hypothetical protein
VLGPAALVAVGLLAGAALARWRQTRSRDPVAELGGVLRRSGSSAGVTLRRLEGALAGAPRAEAYVRALRDARYGWGAVPGDRGGRRAARRAVRRAYNPRRGRRL